MMVTGIPNGMAFDSRSKMFSFFIRTQPWLTAVPINSGLFVPWIPITPSANASVSTSVGENADNPNAIGPYEPSGLVAPRVP